MAKNSHRQVFWVLLWVIFCGLSPISRGQTTTATLSGVIADESGGVLPGAQITITNVATGARRTTTTGEQGRFVVPQLSPGPYEVTITVVGFETLVRRGITLTVGQEANLNLRMQVGAVTQQVTVVGEAPLVNTATSSVSGVVEERRITDLPLNGRDFTQLALLQPGIVSVRNADSIATKGFGIRVSAAGSRADQTAWLLDGTNIKSMANMGTPGSSSGLLLGVDAVQEFQVLTSNYSAEFGGTSGGVVNMVTKSGTNELHGTAYEFHRNDNLDARNFFDIPDKPDFKRNQFGFSLGGPIKKDKVFAFGNFEGLRQRLGLTRVSVVPDENAHLGLIPDGSGGLEQVQVASSIRPILDAWPLPNGGLILDKKGNPSGLGTRFSPGSDRTDQNYFMIRADYNISDNQTIFTRFTFDQTDKSFPDPLPISDNLIPTRTRYATVQYERILSPRFLSTSRVAFNRTALISRVALNIAFPAETFVFDKDTPAQFSFSGATPFGPRDRNLFGNVQNLWEFSQNFSYTPGNHSLKFGTNIGLYWFNNFGGGGITGDFDWASLEDFLQDKELDDFGVTVPGSSTFRSFRQNVYGFYLQDDWRWRPSFTWNFGLRYEPFTTPKEKWDRESVVRDWLTATQFDLDIPFWDNPSLRNFSPRVGFAWDVTGDGKTAVRGGFGVFFVNTLGFYYRSMSQKNPPFAANIENPIGNFATTPGEVARIGPSLLTPLMNPKSDMEIIQWDLDPSYEMKVNLTVERELPGNLSVVLGYLGGRGNHLWRSTVANASFSTMVDGREFVARGTPRPNPNAGRGDFRASDAKSFYNGLQFQLKKRFSQGFQLQSSYTWSRTIDDSSTATANSDYKEGASSRPYNTKADRGLAAFHQAHNFVLNGLWSLPSPGGSALASHIFGGWQASGIFSANTGTPILVSFSSRHVRDNGRSNVQRPDLVAGRSFDSLVQKGNIEHYFDLSGFARPDAGFYGNLGRNVVLGPGFANFDFNLKKDIPLGISEGSRLEFRADFFNLFNRANFAIPNFRRVINGKNFKENASAGKIISTVSTSRQLQFGLKLVF